MDYNLSTIFEKTQNEIDAFEFAQNIGLINITNRICFVCGGNMNKERGKTRHSLNARLRCGKKTCRKTVNIYSESIFENIHLPVSKAIRCLYMYCSKYSYKNIAEELNIDRRTVSGFIKKVISVFNRLNRNEFYGKLGMSLPETIIEIDETHIVSRRDGRGRILRGEQIWVIGAICRVTKMIRLKVVKKRNKNVCERFAITKITRNRKIISDMWPGYRDLNWCGFDHYSVNHSENFVDPNIPWVHTQHIERLWRSLKESINLKSNKLSSLKTEIRKFEFFHNFGAKSSSEKFKQLVLLNSA